MKISIVIPTLNENENIDILIAAINEQTIPVQEIIVVDGGSSDDTVATALKYPNVKVINAMPHVGAQRQKGLEIAEGEIVFFMDADVIPSNNFIDYCVAEFKKRKLQAACPKYLPFPSSISISMTYSVLNFIFFLLQKILASGAGSCIMVEKDFALKIGGFRKDLMYEDIEFIRRSSRRGRFGMLKSFIKVSDRRFRQYGIFNTIGKYMILSFFFSLGLFKLAEIIKYQFAEYKQSESEYVVLVNENNESIGKMSKHIVHTDNTPLHKGFSLFIFNNDCKVLMQQRSGSKKTWPLEWSNSCCGHPKENEKVEDAAMRRAHYELGIDDLEIFCVLPNYRYKAEKNGIVENETCPVMVGFTSRQPIPNADEVADTKWIEWNELVSCAANSDILTPWCIEEVKLLDSSPEFKSILERFNCSV